MKLTKDRQVTSATVRFGKVFSAEARTDYSPLGLLAVGAMVTGILLGSAVIVAVSKGRKKKAGEQSPPAIPITAELGSCRGATRSL
ncbi:hypothetical protein [Novosphingobium guangzhouense]|uniref:Uncharacterized protein n=1 Tax=Novosphingobium guangzhouense TaxID=1850347 RepID=A0A2K2FYI1_9SPHN|nr:hypothetical protein [Novosphingobium guangzhouense]PNU03851.1 hypothetical protein A8V01_22085 [Novosphingobium guangzhouense]